MTIPTRLVSLVFFMVAVAVVAVPAAFWPILTLPGTGSLSQKLRGDNVTTNGEITAVGASKVIYGYNTPSFSRKPWSFQREQVISTKDITRFSVGMTVPVEYSRTVEGASRIKGYGTGSILLHEQVQLLKMMEGAIFFGSIVGLLLMLVMRGKR